MIGSASDTSLGTTRCPGLLCLNLALPISGQLLLPGRALPLRLRSYEPMRQSQSLCLPMALASVSQSLQVAVNPCWEWDLPDVISAILA